MLPFLELNSYSTLSRYSSHAGPIFIPEGFPLTGGTTQRSVYVSLLVIFLSLCMCMNLCVCVYVCALVQKGERGE